MILAPMWERVRRGSKAKINKVLVANRGEIAIRVMRACRELGIASVAIYSEADQEALFAKYATEAYFIGPSPAPESYLNIRKIIEMAKECGAQAIHPGYGFLSENPSFAYACEREGIKFIGPSSKVIELMGNKVAARKQMKKINVPIIPGTEGGIEDIEQARKATRRPGVSFVGQAYRWRRRHRDGHRQQ